MFFTWNETTRRYLAEASENTGYDRALAAHLLPLLQGTSLCDLGCGLGLVDLELAPTRTEVFCADLSAYAVESLRTAAAERGIGNLTARCADARTLPGTWDTVMALFSCEHNDDLPAFFRRARQRFLMVTRSDAEGNTGPLGYRVRKENDRVSAERYLRAHGFRFSVEEDALEYGQPHRSLADALEYTRTFSHAAPPELLEAHVRRTVMETGRADFPYYTPKTRHFAIFILDRAENEAALQAAQSIKADAL